MSRIGKKPMSMPAGVKVSNDAAARTLSVEGPKGKLRFQYRPEVAVAVDDSSKQIRCTIPKEKLGDRQMRAYWGTTRARVQNMLTGVSQGYVRKLEVVGVGWNAKLQGKTISLSVGYCNPIQMPVPDGVAATVENNNITISGCDKQAVGQFAAEIRSKRKPEPYNGKGIKYSDEIITRKQGKAFGA
jgi:large subunit ribosomal protein L6